jgi:TonB family protein
VILTPMVIADAPTCATPNKSIGLVTAATPTYPEAAKKSGLGAATVLVQVTVNPDGTLANAHILRSSDNFVVDEAALRAIKASTYSPMLYNCGAIGASTIFKVEMIPDGASSIQPDLPNPAASGPTRPVCKNPDTDATVLKAVSPAVPQGASVPRSVTVIVKVSIAANGAVSALHLLQSSGDPSVDRAVLKAVRESTFAPRYVDCEPLASDYLFRVQISPMQHP